MSKNYLGSQSDYIAKKWNDGDASVRKVRILCENFQANGDYHFAKIKNELVLQKGKGDKYSICAHYSGLGKGVYHLNVN